MGEVLSSASLRLRTLTIQICTGAILVSLSALADEATKVRLVGSRIVAIGKDLVEYDALDTGVFVFSPVLFDALERARNLGDTTLSGGVRELASRGLMRGVEIGDATWCDIDTLSDLAAAESALGAPSA